MSTDSIADMLVTIKNGLAAQKQSVQMPFSKVKKNIAKELLDLNLISAVKEKNNKLIIDLAYKNRQPKITNIKRISKPGLRIYQNISDLKNINRKLGWFIISTPKGIMTADKAIKSNLGGEVICQVW